MNLSRKSFLSSVAGFFAGIPFLGTKKKVKETFTVQIEELGKNQYRATLKTSGLLTQKIAVIQTEPTDYTPSQWVNLGLMESIQKAMHLHLFPEDEGLKWVGHVELDAPMNGKQFVQYDRNTVLPPVSIIKSSDLFTESKPSEGIRKTIADSARKYFQS